MSDRPDVEITNIDASWPRLWHTAGMPKRSSKRDVNQIAADVVSAATGIDVHPAQPEKNPAAVALGRLGGLKGGKARSNSLSKARRAQIARKAARTRWGGNPK